MSAGDALEAIVIATVELAVWDLRAGRGRTATQRRNYTSAMQFLRRAGLLERVLEAHGLELEPEPEQLELLELAA